MTYIEFGGWVVFGPIHHRCELPCLHRRWNYWRPRRREVKGGGTIWSAGPIGLWRV